MFTDNEFDIKPTHRDELGLDPFLLRTCPIVENRSFEVALRACCLNSDDVDFSAMDLHDAGKNEVPHRIFFIWTGSAFSAPKSREFVQGWRAANPRHAIVLATDQIDTQTHPTFKQESAAYQDMLQWAKHYNICLVNYAEFTTPSLFVRMSLLEKNHGKLSDGERFVLLKTFRGVYVDIDIFAKKLADKIVLKSGLAMCQPTSITSSQGFSNDYLMAAHGEKAEKFLQAILDRILKNTTLGLVNLFVAPDVPVVPHKLSLNTLKEYSTVMISGPSMLRHFYFDADDVGPYKSASEKTWLNVYEPLKTESDSEAIKRIITVILFNLTQDLRSLRFELFMREFKNPYIRNNVFDLLEHYFLREMKSVRWIFIGIKDIRLDDIPSLKYTLQRAKTMAKKLHPTDVHVALFSGPHPIKLADYLFKPFNLSDIPACRAQFNNDIVEFYKEMTSVLSITPNIEQLTRVFEYTLADQLERSGIPFDVDAVLAGAAWEENVKATQQSISDFHRIIINNFTNLSQLPKPRRV